MLHLGTLVGTGELAGGPRTLGYAIGVLDQLSRRMRAVATAGSVTRLTAATERARRRRQDPPPRALQLVFRTARWPGWVRTDPDGHPSFEAGVLVLDVEHPGLPPVGSDSYRMVLRDAYLLAGLKLPLHADGRAIMALRHQGQIPPAERRPRPDQEQLELAELAHRTGEPIGVLARTDREYRREWLVRLRDDDARQGREAMQHLRDLISRTERHRPGSLGELDAQNADGPRVRNSANEPILVAGHADRRETAGERYRFGTASRSGRSAEHQATPAGTWWRARRRVGAAYSPRARGHGTLNSEICVLRPWRSVNELHERRLG